jgi:ATP-binding cassette subfamily F protein uup
MQNFRWKSAERVGLIGRNGTGKSSLLKIIAGSSKLDDGLMVMQQGLKIAYVEQEPHFSPETCRCSTQSRPGWVTCPALLAEYDTSDYPVRRRQR